MNIIIRINIILYYRFTIMSILLVTQNFIADNYKSEALNFGSCLQSLYHAAMAMDILCSLFLYSPLYTMQLSLRRHSYVIMAMHAIIIIPVFILTPGMQ